MAKKKKKKVEVLWSMSGDLTGREIIEISLSADCESEQAPNLYEGLKYYSKNKKNKIKKAKNKEQEKLRIKKKKNNEYQKRYRAEKKKEKYIKKFIDDLMVKVNIEENKFNRWEIMDLDDE